MSTVAEPPVRREIPPPVPRADRRRDPLWALGAATVGLVLAAIGLKLWRMQVHVPLFQSGDALYELLLVKTVMHQGWLGVNDSIGAPFGSALYDHVVAFGDTTQLLLVKILGLFSSDPALVMNALFVLGFPIVAAVTFMVLRALGFGPLVAATCAVVYTLLPYHFYRNESHLMLGTYWSVPVAGWLILGLLGHARLFERRRDGGTGVRAWASRRSALVILGCVVVGSSEVYYAVFALAILAVVTPIVALAQREWKRVVAPAVVGMVVALTALLVQAPQLIWHAQNGANSAVGQRSPFESEVYGLKLAALVTPANDHDLGPLADFGAKYWNRTQLGGEGLNPWLGSTLTIGFLVVLLAVAAGAFGRLATTRRARLLRDTGAVTVVALLISTIGGVSTIFAYLVSPQIRGWDRMSVFIAFFAVIGLAVALTATGERLRRRRRGPALAAALAIGVVIVAAIDQTTPSGAPRYGDTLATWRSDARFVNAIEAQVPGDGQILQLPYVPFPENPPVGNMADYDELKGYVHSDRLRWSYAATKGRTPDDWGAASAQRPLEQVVPAAAAADFRGVWVDTYGYGDAGAGVVRTLTALTGAGPTAVSDDHRLLFFDLGPVRAKVDGAGPEIRTGAAAALIRPIVPGWAGGFYPLAEGDGTSMWHWMHATGELHLDNTAAQPRRVRMTMSLLTPGATAQPVTITLPDGTTETVRTDPTGPRRISRVVTLPPGPQAVRFATPAPDDPADPRDLRLRVIDLDVADLGFTRLAAEVR